MKLITKFLGILTVLACGNGMMPVAHAQSLSDQPLFSPLTVPGNLLLTLSVEYPTADSTAYPTTSAYSSSSSYVGYFDPTKCYTYQYNSTNIQNSFFAPYSTPSVGVPAVCVSTSTLALWSGNFLNWATMSTIDPFRWALTGGYRSQLGANVQTATSTTVAAASGDTAPASSTPAITILERAWESVGQGSFGNGSGDDFPDHVISGTSTIAGATPFKGLGCLVMRSGGMGNLEYFTASAATVSGTANACPSESGNLDSGNGDAAGSNPSGDCYGGSLTTACTSTAVTAVAALSATGVATASASGVVYYNGATYNTSTGYSNSANYGVATVITGVATCSSLSGTFSKSNSNCKVSKQSYNGTTYNGTYSCAAVGTYNGTTYVANASSSSLCAIADTTAVAGCAWSSSWTSSTAANICAGTGGASSYTGATTGTIYEIAIRNQVCDPTLGGTVSASASNVESNCVAYTPVATSSTAYDYKPQGLMQQYATQIDYGVFGYLNDSGDNRDGGVLRANMKFIGPQNPVPGGTSTTNSNTEWNSSTGVYVANPNPTDVTNTNTACNNAVGVSNCATFSGVLNYLNGFGENAHSYKSSDPVSELYYAGIRYYKNLGNVPNWSDFTSPDAATSGTISTQTDGFPVITTWNDPIQYACQKNFILGIGDVNTHADGDTPHSYFDGSSYSNPSWSQTAASGSKAESAYVNTDPVNTEMSTNAVGVMEANDTTSGPLSQTTTGTGLGDTVTPWDGGDGDNATFVMAGLAYDAHVTDMRPTSFTQFLNPNGSKTYPQTVSTFWLDVQEYQTFQYQNQFWLAAKYGGFTVPSSYSEYGSAGSLPSPLGTASPTDFSVAPSSATSFTATKMPSLTKSSWYTTSRTQGGNLLPDNYFPASNATDMVNGLTTAFSNIVSQATATTTAFATVNPQVTVSGNIDFSASYDQGTWTGTLLASSLSFNNSGLNPTIVQDWNAQTTLESNASAGSGVGWKNRVIITNNAAPSESASKASGVFLSALSNATYTSALSSNCPDKNSGNCINYLSGDRTNEGVNGDASYRVRAFLLGDIADSQVAPIGPPDQPFAEAYNPGYSAFKTASASRPLIAYVGANDGMLHAFDGSITDGNNGLEFFAYMPGFGFQGPGSGAPSPLNTTKYLATPSINGLPSYGNKSFVHHFFVDATPVVSDVDFDDTSTSVGTNTSTNNNWHSVLIGGLGKGGAGYYALDVTDPTGVNTTTAGPLAHQLTATPGTAPTSSNAAPAKVLLWEFSDSDEGFSYGDPTVVKTKTYGWVALLPSGYDNPSGVGKIYVVDVSTGALLETISTANSLDTKKIIGTPTKPAGLAWISAFVANIQDDTTDYAYAGDQFGQVWRFDLTGATPPSTCTAAGGCPVIVATLTDSSGNAQQITTRPLIEVDPNSGNRYILVGTGQELSSSDLTTTNAEDFYVIQDGNSVAPFPAVAMSTAGCPTTGTTGSTTPSNPIPCGGIIPSMLKNVTTNFTPGTSGTPQTSTPVTAANGFYINLNSGYRVVTTPTVNGDDVAFAANQPTGGVCEASGTNETYALAFAGPLAGTSLLTSSGSSVPYISSTGSAVNINFVNVSGTITNANGTTSNLSTVSLMVGTDVAGITTPTGNFNPTPIFKILNWQEVSPSN